MNSRRRRGSVERVSAITAAAMRGELDFEAALRERVALLAGLSLSTVERVLRERITEASGARTLVATMRAHGAWTALVSGGFTVFSEAVAARLGFDQHRANVLDVVDEKLIGTVREPILGADAKALALQTIARDAGADADSMRSPSATVRTTSA